MMDFNELCTQFAKILKGKSNIDHGVCSVSLHRNLTVSVQGLPSTTVIPADVLFESLDQNGYALNLAEIAILEAEVPLFMQSIIQQGLIVSALHNHWIFMEPHILYIHIQSVEPPLNFARKLAHAFSTLSSYPISSKNK
ncbi:DUF1259 domain-containing protein [Lederbergia citrea]|uniref:DUF1259 domain-containing protein n=1 Tax=Lederbergia citrea TaxID=2833581 RepID=A0A942UMW6_9BACI|nr:DUF1259 domain-containing protein [Lederbergia citrea]MBS4223595.1 DUF1259 domain-containing protein [Lederbergia citrea]